MIEAFVTDYCGSPPGPWEDIFTQDQVSRAVDALKEILTQAGTSCFSMPDESILLPLVRMLREQIPPCGSDLSGSENPANRNVDFRHILFAGWIVADELAGQNDGAGKGGQFLVLNKLCEMGLLQQRAIDRYKAAKEGGTS